MSKDFNEYRFRGLNHRTFSNKYLTMDRVSEDESKIVVKIAGEHLFKTKYGYGLILDASHVVWLKEWAVSTSYYGNEIMLDRGFFNVKEWGDFSDNFDDEPENCTWEHYLQIAKAQAAANNHVRWEQ